MEQQKCEVCGIDWDVPDIWHGKPAPEKSWPHEICEYEEMFRWI